MNWLKTVDETVVGLGYELVDCERGTHGLLRVYIDRLPQNEYDQASEHVTVEDCEKVTRQLQYALEVSNADYARLEVSSPGLDRILKTPQHFERFEGAEVAISLKQPFQGRRNYKGLLGRFETLDAANHLTNGGVSQDRVWQLMFKQGEGKNATEQVLGFSLDEISEARLVPTVNFKGRGLSKPAANSSMNSENKSNEP